MRKPSAFLLTGLLLPCLLLLAACKEDSYVYPDAVTEFVCIQTNAEGNVAALLTDDGETLRIDATHRHDSLALDSIYRAVSLFERIPGTEDRATLYQCRLVTSPRPKPATQFQKGIKTDPIGIQSLWRSGDYLNMILLAKVKQWPHYYHFIHEGITHRPDGRRTLQLRLYHNQNADDPAFTERVYLSVPLWAYRDSLSAGDSIRFCLNTFEEGDTYRMFDY